MHHRSNPLNILVADETTSAITAVLFKHAAKLRTSSAVRIPYGGGQKNIHDIAAERSQIEKLGRNVFVCLLTVFIVVSYYLFVPPPKDLSQPHPQARALPGSSPRSS